MSWRSASPPGPSSPLSSLSLAPAQKMPSHAQPSAQLPRNAQDAQPCPAMPRECPDSSHGRAPLWRGRVSCSRLSASGKSGKRGRWWWLPRLMAPGCGQTDKHKGRQQAAVSRRTGLAEFFFFFCVGRRGARQRASALSHPPHTAPQRTPAWAATTGGTDGGEQDQQPTHSPPAQKKWPMPSKTHRAWAGRGGAKRSRSARQDPWRAPLSPSPPPSPTSQLFPSVWVRRLPLMGSTATLSFRFAWGRFIWRPVEQSRCWAWGSTQESRQDGAKTDGGARLLRWLLFWCCFGKEGSFSRDAGMAGGWAALLRVSAKTTRGWAWAGEGAVCPLELHSSPCRPSAGTGCVAARLVACWVRGLLRLSCLACLSFFCLGELPVLLVCLASFVILAR